MSGHQHATLEDTVYFWFASNDTSGSGDDGASALFDVREAGAAASAAPLLSGTPDLLSHANYPAGCYEVAVAATAANGFAAGDTFAVFCTLAVDSQNPSGFVGSCTLGPIVANVTQVSGDATAADNLEADYDGTGYNKSNSTIGTTTTNTDMRGTDSAYTGTPPTAAAIADQVWDEAQADHVAAGSFGVTATEIADILTDTADMQPKLGTPAADVSADIAAIKAETALIVADTNELQTDDVPGLIATAQADLDTLTGTDGVTLATSQPNYAPATAADAASPAEVATEIADALHTDAVSELSGDPGASPTIGDALMLLYMALRNKLDITATTKEIHNNAGTNILTKTVSDDGTTYSESQGRVVAVDSAEKRRSLSGIQASLMPGVTPNASKDAEWRQEAGWGYPGISAGTPVPEVESEGYAHLIHFRLLGVIR